MFTFLIILPLSLSLSLSLSSPVSPLLPAGVDPIKVRGYMHYDGNQGNILRDLPVKSNDAIHL